jgi:ABC-2 type transport system ATP-binding protein
MTAAAMIQALGLVKHYRSTLAVDHLSFDVRPGTVTGFLGPNGVGKPVTKLWLSLPSGHLASAAERDQGPRIRSLNCGNGPRYAGLVVLALSAGRWA